MKSFIMACVAAIVIAVIGGVVLNSIQEPVEKPTRRAACASARKSRLSADQSRVGQEADAGSGFDCRHILRKFQQSVSLRQRCENARAILRVFDRFDFAIRARA